VLTWEICQQEGNFAAQQQAIALGKQALRGQRCLLKQASFLVQFSVCEAKQCAVSQSISQNTRSLLVEQALLSVEAKLMQPASPCFQCNQLSVPANLPEWLLFGFDLDGRQRQSNVPERPSSSLDSNELTMPSGRRRQHTPPNTQIRLLVVLERTHPASRQVGQQAPS